MKPFAWILAIAGLLLFPSSPSQAEVMDAKQFINQYCVSCHGGNEADIKGGFDLRPMIASASLEPHLGKWHDVLDTIEFQEMPPPKPADIPRPTEREYQGMLAWLEHGILNASGAPSRYARRLNRAQYNNTIRDLLHIDPDPADLFPQDLGEEGFDTVARVQSISPYLWNKYAEAADRVVRLAAAPTAKPQPIKQRFFPLDRDQRAGKSKIKNSEIDLGEAIGKRPKVTEEGYAVMGLDWGSGSPGKKGGVREGHGAHGYEVVLDHSGNSGKRGQLKFKNPLPYGRFKLTFEAYAEAKDREGKPFEPFDACIAGIYVNGILAERISIPIGEKPQTYEYIFESDFENTEVRIAAASQVGRSHQKAIPRLVLCEAAIEGPLYDQWPPASHRAIFGDNPEATPREWLEPFITRAFRRPATAEEVDRYLAIYEEELGHGADAREAGLVAAQAVLVSPSFLYLIEEERPGGQLSDYELANRLSYFLWASMPDEELFQLAAAGRLQQSAVYRQQVARMLDDPKAEALTQEFAGQWLALRRIKELVPDPDIFKEFDDELREAMREESEAFFREVLTNNLPVRNFLDSPFTFANQRLARHYELPPVEGAEMRKVSLTDDHARGGVVSQAGILAVYSQQTRSSPVMRGVFVLEKLFNRPPPTPPANVPALPEPEPGEKVEAKTLREQLAQHAANPSCAGCHEKIDPWGLALEEFNGIGAYRTVEPETVSTKLFDGTPVQGVRGLKKELVKRETDFVRGLTEKLLIYGLGRTLTSSDRRSVDQMLTMSGQADYGLKAVILSVAESDLFRRY